MDGEEATADRQRWRIEVATARGVWTSRFEARRGEATNWHLEPLVKDPADLEALAGVGWEVEQPLIDLARRSYEAARASAGEQHALRYFISSPLVCVSGCMSFEDFLEFSIVDSARLHELCFAEPSYIATRVREILRDGGPRRLILSASAGPISAVDERLVTNYRTMVDTARA